MKRLRIGFNARCLEEPETRGLSRYTACLLRELSKSTDAELVLFAMNPPHPDHMQGVRADIVLGSGRETAWQEQWLPNRLRDERIDIFHAPADRGLPLRKPCPFVVTVHDSYERTHWRELFRGMKPRAWYWKNEIANRFRADAVLTVSDTTARDLRRLGVATEQQLRRVYLAASAEFCAEPAIDDEAIVARHGVRARYVLYVGGYDRRKNVGGLVRAFDAAQLRDHELVVIARKSADYPALNAQWRGLASAARLHFLEVPIAELPAFYRRADLFVNPSLWESFSFQTLEAMACGTPLLASDRQAIPEIAGDAAELVDASAVRQLAARMRELLADPVRRTALRDSGLARAAQFSWHATAGATMQVYRDVMASTAGTAAVESSR